MMLLVFPFYLLLFYLAPLCWILPYVWGMIAHHWLAHNLGKATAWFILYLLIHPVLYFYLFVAAGVAQVDIMYELSHGGSIVSFAWLTISTIVMPLQTVLWYILWFKRRQNNEFNGWRTVGVTALLVSLLFTIPLVLYYAIEVSTRVETHIRNIETKQEIKQAVDELTKDIWDIQKRVCFKPYPNIRWSDTGPNYDVDWYYHAGRFATYAFGTKDSAEKVIGYYADCASNAGLKIQRGTYDSYYPGPKKAVPAMVATGKDKLAMVVYPVFTRGPDEWDVIILWEINDNFHKAVKEHFKLK